MGRQWLHAKRAVASLKKGRATGKLVREIMVAAKIGGADPELNARRWARHYVYLAQKLMD